MKFYDVFHFVKPGWVEIQLYRKRDDLFRIMNDQNVEHCMKCMKELGDSEVIHIEAIGNKMLKFYLD